MATLTPAQQKFLRENSIVVLSTANEEHQPRSVYVEANKIEEDKIIITDNQMETTKENILNNAKVCVLASSPNYTFLQMDGIARYETSGEYFEYVKTLPSNIWHTPKWVVIISIVSVKEGT